MTVVTRNKTRLKCDLCGRLSGVIDSDYPLEQRDIAEECVGWVWIKGANVCPPCGKEVVKEVARRASNK